jgi:hypothetical protein
LRECTVPSTVTNYKTTTVTTIKYDTITDSITSYIPKYYTKIISKTDTVYKDIDTTAILADYFSTYVYSDTVKKDSLTVIINDSVSENKIRSRNIQYTMLYRTILTETTIEKILNNREFYIGVGLIGNANNFSYIGPEVLLRTTKRQAYGLGIGVNNNFEPTVGIKMYWKIGKK